MDPTSPVRRLTVEVAPDDVWRCLGPAGGAHDRLAGDIEDAIAEAERLAEPASATRELLIESAGHGEVTFEGGLTVRGPMLSHLMEGADGGVFLLATAGPGIGHRVAELFANDRLVEAMLLDAAGSAIAMNAQSDTVGRIAGERELAGFRVGPCLVPGNQYWDLEGQRAVFAALPAKEIGVRLLNSLQMDPQKSQSALIPYGADLRILDDPDASPCGGCKATRCPMRLEPYNAAQEIGKPA